MSSKHISIVGVCIKHTHTLGHTHTQTDMHPAPSFRRKGCGGGGGHRTTQDAQQQGAEQRKSKASR